MKMCTAPFGESPPSRLSEAVALPYDAERPGRLVALPQLSSAAKFPANLLPSGQVTTSSLPEVVAIAVPAEVVRRNVEPSGCASLMQVCDPETRVKFQS